MRNVGLTQQAIAKIEEHDMYRVPIEPTTTANGDLVPLNKYCYVSDLQKETIEFLDHMIAEFQDRRQRVLDTINEEYFQEYIQAVEDDQVFLSLKHGPRQMDPVKYPTLVYIKAYNWTEEQMLVIASESKGY